ncbi:hypothetical protein A3K48_05835 [candidate division WOR-1 bacterium RIFOXYA12_FULL_52_29]|uniref:Uncharacterized protein n=1 Tax=candidate division WOR-1 bacterium RIFOXYC12_FULL_54_18 TaxID=1802584 RepID=A0A1F4T7H3_UNCSA|nr:MAG: hypothetical protein A3K44_05835 [candidate division WOR-1 bacterium RIFOXYA2_FULL_51_19]OGC18052.1 MAG: hypothetical protein A3K48_05835 [candidate division WOR-1 bacterium RIFOXYA12_FULL_52_29]OGC26908.1 MAG: hypothetical protein A3K32_05830 [candidate division WOR-1 bacterium RIFOXYB2_FULL_45_9]OGC28469.1 MAG: hypothetical protein A3K49_05835 [candidate division WOR-1 bacterium RIFOXYC12_FULL_54_18]OGC31076.1 MAG: hypothetical protein A2346_06785 [candidate division WOR-1 bacterium R
MKKQFVAIIALLFLIMPAAAEEPAMTKDDAVLLISAVKNLKNRLNDLFSFTTGYDLSKVNQVRLTPTINWVKVAPKKAPPDGQTILEIVAAVDDPRGVSNIAGVRADLTGIGQLSDAQLLDNGKFGDVVSGDGLFTLLTTIMPGTTLGPKDINISAVNRNGWMALAKTTVDVEIKPLILEAKAVPEKLSTQSGAFVTLVLRVDNPGRPVDVKNISADIRPLGFQDALSFRNDGQDGDIASGDDTWTLRFILPKNLSPGNYLIPIEVVNFAGGSAAGKIPISIY